MKKPVSEPEYRRRLRVLARIMDYGTELMGMGYEEELLQMFKKDAVKGTKYQQKLTQLFNSFIQKPLGYEEELLCLFDKYDNLLKNCSDPKERQAIGVLGVMQVNKLLDNGDVGIGGELSLNRQTVLKGKSVAEFNKERQNGK